MPHEPCGFHAAAEHPLKLARADAFLAGAHQVDRLKPVRHRRVGILEDRSCLERELRGGVLLTAVPAVILFEEKHVLALTARADHAIHPATGHKVFAAVDRI